MTTEHSCGVELGSAASKRLLFGQAGGVVCKLPQHTSLTSSPLRCRPLASQTASTPPRVWPRVTACTAPERSLLGIAVTHLPDCILDFVYGRARRPPPIAVRRGIDSASACVVNAGCRVIMAAGRVGKRGVVTEGAGAAVAWEAQPAALLPALPPPPLVHQTASQSAALLLPTSCSAAAWQRHCRSARCSGLPQRPGRPPLGLPADLADGDARQWCSQQPSKEISRRRSSAQGVCRRCRHAPTVPRTACG